MEIFNKTIKLNKNSKIRVVQSVKMNKKKSQIPHYLNDTISSTNKKRLKISDINEEIFHKKKSFVFGTKNISDYSNNVINKIEKKFYNSIKGSNIKQLSKSIYKKYLLDDPYGHFEDDNIGDDPFGHF